MTQIVIPWPATAGQLLVLSQIVVCWTAVVYMASADTTDQRAPGSSDRAPPRFASDRRTVWSAFAGAITVALLPGISAVAVLPRILLAAGFALLVLILPFVRGHLTWAAIVEGGSATRERSYPPLAIATWELAANATMIVFAAIVVATWEISVSNPVLVVPGTNGQLAAVSVAAASAIFLCRGGTYVVRSILDAAGAVPRGTDHQPHARAGNKRDATQQDVDTNEYNRGRLIGNIERLVLVLVVVVGSYEALGFLIAAKGLIRAREFEDRDFAEYFLIGSLASVLLALLAAMALHYSLPVLWRA